MPEYILKDYDDPKILRHHWGSYLRVRIHILRCTGSFLKNSILKVNYHFAINAVRNSRPQDILWIHDVSNLVENFFFNSKIS